jgi:hypothetical protein
VYRVAFQTATLDLSAVDELQGCINEEEFTLTIKSLGFTKTFEAQSTILARCPTTCTLTGNPKQPVFWNVEYELHYRAPITSPIDETEKSGWTLFVKDQGYAKLTGGTPPLTTIKGEDGVPLNVPTLLDGSGNPYTGTGAKYLQFTASEPVADFTPLFQGIS